MLNKTQKENIVKDLQEKFAKKEMAVFVSLAGVKVKTLEEVRRQLKEEGSELIVVKKTFLARVLGACGIHISLKDIAGPFGIVFDYASQTKGLRVLSTAASTSALKMVRALWRETIFEGDQLKELALLPPLAVLLARLLMVLAQPMSDLLLLLSSQPRSFLLILNHYNKQKEKSLSTSS